MINRVMVKGIGSYGEDVPSIEFGRGRNVIVGENATGKSALLFAIEVGFLGSLEDWDLRDIINDNVEEAEVTIDFTHPKTGNNLQIYRKFRRIRAKKGDKSKEGGKQIEVYLKNIDTGEILANKPTSVENALRAIGIDKNVFLNIVHVKQGRIDRVLRSSEIQREIFDKLFHIHDIKNALSELGSKRGEVYSGILKELDNKRQGNKEKITARMEMANEYDTKKSELEGLKKRVEELSAQKKKREEELEQFTKLWNAVKPLAIAIEKMQRNIQTLHNSIEQIDSLLSGLYGQVKSKNNELYDKIKKIIIEAKHEPSKEKQIVEIIGQRIKEIEEKEKSLADLEKRGEIMDEELKKWFGKCTSLKDQIEKLNLQIERIENFLKGKQQLPEIRCELCGSLLKPSEYGEHLEEVRKERDNKNGEFSNAKASLEDANKLYSTIKAQIQEINELLKEKSVLSSLVDPIDTQLKSKLYSIGKLKECHEDLEGNLEKFNKLFGETVPIENITDKLSEIKTSVDTLPIKIKQAQDEIERIDKEQIPKLIVEVERRRKAREDIANLEKENKEISRKIEFLIGEIRPALDDIQPIIRRLFIDSINNRASIYFDKFYGKESKYKREDIRKIWMDDGYRFWVDRLGHIRQATRLSGGQEIIVSLCFLFALLDELGSSLGFILLDEPSNHLDDKRVEELIEVLKGLQNVPQLIVVDHKQELIDTADIKYEVFLRNGFSQITRIT
ncbi:MAG: AAA family ATPase [Nitrososphaerales archaeon]